MTSFRRALLAFSILACGGLASAPAFSLSQITGEDGNVPPGREGIIAVPLPPVPGQPVPETPANAQPAETAPTAPAAAPAANPPAAQPASPPAANPAETPVVPVEGAEGSARPPEGEVAPIEIVYGDKDLPQPVRDLRAKLMEVARTGEIEKLRPYFQTGADPTVVSATMPEQDPVTTLKEASGDGEGVELLAILLETLEAGHVRLDPGGDNEIYVWPYFTQVDLERLTKPQLVQLFELVTAGDYQRMVANGSYDFYRVGISPEGASSSSSTATERPCLRARDRHIGLETGAARSAFRIEDTMPHARLSDRATLHLTGVEAEPFLQNLVTADLAGLGPGEARPAALLTPQGKILFDFLVSRIDDGLRLDVASGARGDLAKRLTLYKLRAKVTIAPSDETVSAVWDAAETPDGALADRRFPTESIGLWRGLRRRRAGGLRGAAAVARHRRGGAGFPRLRRLPARRAARPERRRVVQEGLLCRPGGRLAHAAPGHGASARDGAARRGAPDAGGESRGRGQDDRHGALSRGSVGIGLVRIDRLADALMAGETPAADGVPLEAEVPAWAGYALPEPGAGGEA